MQSDQSGERSEVDLSSLSDSAVYDVLCRLPPDTKALRSLIERFEFGSLFRDIPFEPEVQRGEKATGASYLAVYADDFPAFVEMLEKQEQFAFDIETTSLNVLEAQVVGASFCWQDDIAYYIPLLHKSFSSPQVSFEQFVEGTWSVFESASVKKIGQNLKYDVSVLLQHGINVRGVAFDTMLASYLLNPDKGSHNLTVLAKEHLTRGLIEYDELVGENADFTCVAIDSATEYCCQDSHCAWLLWRKLAPLIREHGLERVLDEVEVPLITVLAKMELAGVKLDTEFLFRMSEEFGSEMDGMKSKLYELAGTEFNLNSPKQLSDILFNKLGLSTKGLKKTKTGISTDSSVLERLRHDHPLPDLILHYRMLQKLKSTYIDALPAQVSPYSGRLHTSFNQAVTGTGRLSSSDPNLQNIPISTAQGRRIRRAFVADVGKVMVSADYSQIELRLLAHLSHDRALMQAFNEGVDIHAQTAREILSIPAEEEVPAESRRIGKTINFGVVYGMGAFRLARELGIPIPLATQYIENYFRRFSGVKEFFAHMEEEARTKGMVYTMFGRRRVLADIDPGGRDQGFVLRAAMNAPIQGSAADLIKLAMVKISRRIEEDRLPFRMLLQIHDELVFEAEEESASDAITIIRSEMENVVQLDVPLKVDVGSGPTWEDAH